MRDEVLWQEIYEQALASGMDKYSAEIYATDTMNSIEEMDAMMAWDAYDGEY